MAQKLKCSCFLSIISYSYNVTIVISYYCNLVTFQTITPRYKLLATKQVTSYFTSYFKSNQLCNLVTKVTSYPQLCIYQAKDVQCIISIGLCLYFNTDQNIGSIRSV